MQSGGRAAAQRATHPLQLMQLAPAALPQTGAAGELCPVILTKTALTVPVDSTPSPSQPHYFQLQHPPTTSLRHFLSSG
eukprot:m.86374 g.86374  ORF g.86374 m.86374 type:complete len:79 (-) comp8429_c0_seq1:26-262(-)